MLAVVCVDVAITKSNYAHGRSSSKQPYHPLAGGTPLQAEVTFHPNGNSKRRFKPAPASLRDDSWSKLLIQAAQALHLLPPPAPLKVQLELGCCYFGYNR